MLESELEILLVLLLVLELVEEDCFNDVRECHGAVGETRSCECAGAMYECARLRFEHRSVSRWSSLVLPRLDPSVDLMWSYSHGRLFVIISKVQTPRENQSEVYLM